MLKEVKHFVMVEKAVDIKIYELKEKLLTLDPASEAYDDTIQLLEDLYDVKKRCLELKNTKSSRERYIKDWSGIVSSMIGFVGILAILNYEKTDIISSKAMSIATRFIK